MYASPGLIFLILFFENWRFWKTQFWAIFDFFFKKTKKICLIPMKISHKLCDRMDGTQFWCFPWFPGNLLLCVILHYTVYISVFTWMYQTFLIWNDYSLKNNAASKIISSHCVWDCLHNLFLAGFWSLYWVTEIQWSIIESCSLTSLLWWWIDVFLLISFQPTTS